MVSSVQQGVPGVPQTAMVAAGGVPTPAWYQFFVNLWLRTGGASGSPSNILDIITKTVGSILYRASSGWVGLNPGTQFQVLRMGAAVPEWDKIDANPSSNVGLVTVNGTANTFMRSDAAPAISQAIAPTWTGLHTFSAGLSASAVNASSGNISALTGSTAVVTDVTTAVLALLPVAAPGAPASGWVLYTDSGNGNKLTAKASTGTTVILGTP